MPSAGKRVTGAKRGKSLVGQITEFFHLIFFVVKSRPTMSLFYLFVGDVIVLGKSDVFKFNYPSEAAILREKRRSGLYGMVSF